jgi:murein DD-endopeptidase MepM/ murein hydrolase activator NlpD
MEIILISKRRGNQVRARFGTAFVAVVALAGSVLVAAGGLAGYKFADRQHGALVQSRLSENDRGLAMEIARQRQSLVELSEDVKLSLDALAARTASLQSRIIRLDALGSRLTGMANIAHEEFNFDSSPAVGGPLEPQELRSAEVGEVFESLNSLNSKLRIKEEELTALEALLMNRRLEAETQPAGRPVSSGWISSAFGMRSDPVTGKKEFHRGLDFAGRPGSDVLAVGAGVVTWSGSRHGYGKMVEINHGKGYVTRYSHNRENLVEVGDKVDKGQVVARMGSTGRSTGPHVHFEVVHDGKVVNPRTYVSAAHPAEAAVTRR